MKRFLAYIRHVSSVLFALLSLVRAWNVLIIMAAVGLGGYLAAGAAIASDAGHIILIALSAGLLAAAANTMNDLIDMKSDEINHPDRPLVTGLISFRMGLWTCISLYTFSILAVFQLSSNHLLVFGITSGLLLAYNVWLSRLPLIGNFLVALVVALSIPYGAIDVGLVPSVWIASSFAFLTTIIREISKDVEDIHGDMAVGRRSLPMILGTNTSMMVVRTLALLIVFASVVPFLFYSFGGLYLLGMSVTNLLLVLPMSGSSDATEEARQTSSSLKWAMIVGMMALAVSNSSPLGSAL